ncbi:helix-turn-helix domain-containing protein [Yoonia sp. SS1-5]|uniref:Helix-turn-helix domain-containing protein n=1 Tax=Yoonia rhodophyticola TaxID=3137370 RepID=A0AAN0MF12_9RHOB
MKLLGDSHLPSRRLTGARIRERRLDLGLRQSAVAQEVGISPSYLNLIEHNRRRIGGKLLRDLANVLRVDPGQLTDGADTDLLDRMRAAASALGEQVEVARAEEFAARFPGWSALVVEQSRRLSVLEDRVRVLTDRLAYDPQLAASLHEVISAVTAIRSSSSILVGPETLDADWQRRFHQNIHDDSLRLAKNSEALIAYLEAPELEPAGSFTPVEEVEAYLSARPDAFAALEAPDLNLKKFVSKSGLRGAAARALGRISAVYHGDAQVLPLETFVPACRALDYDPARLALKFGVDFAVVLRRLASLQTADGHPPMGLAICDASGTIAFQKPLPGFGLPHAGGACPLWPIFGAMARPSQPLCVDVALPGANASRFLCYAIAEPGPVSRFDAPPVLQSTMLVVPDPPPGDLPALPVGVTCRICPRDNCNSRREPAMTGVALQL